MNNREAIRAVIPNADSAMKVGAIIAALPDINATAIREAIGQMYRSHAIDRTGNKSDGFAYFVCRAVKRKAYATQEERAAGKRKTDAERNRRRRNMTIDQFRASQALKRQQKMEARTEAAVKRAAERLATKNAAIAKRAERAQRLAAMRDERRKVSAINRRRKTCSPAQRLLSNAPARAALPHVTHAPKRVVRVESVAEWQNRTGKRPEVLPMGAVSQPLKFAGQRDIARVTWRQREARAA